MLLPSVETAARLSSLLLVATLPSASARSVLMPKASSSQQCTGTPVDIGYNVTAVAEHAKRLSTHSWEYGATAEALLELYDPDVAVFSPRAFPGGKIPKKQTVGADYAKQFTRTDNVTLVDGDGAVGDPASLGVYAVLLGQSEPEYLEAATRQLNHVVDDAPRWWNGAISHREADAEVWADFVYMAPPFLAYYAVATQNTTLLREAVRQCGLYRQALQDSSTSLWLHIIAPNWGDKQLWSTGNAWAAAGMARVLATVEHWSGSAGGWADEKAELVSYIAEIVDGAIAVGVEPGTGLLRNYLNDTTWFGEVSGTALLSSVVYRLAVLAPETFAQEKYINWADGLREAIVAHVDDTGLLGPAINPLDWHDRTPVYTGSPEGQSFGVLLYTAYRDYLCAK